MFERVLLAVLAGYTLIDLIDWKIPLPFWSRRRIARDLPLLTAAVEVALEQQKQVWEQETQARIEGFIGEAQESLTKVLEAEHDLLLRNDERRIEFFLKQLRLTPDLFRKLRYELLCLVRLPVRDLQEAQAFVEQLIQNPIAEVLHQKQHERLYDRIETWLDLRSLCHSPEVLAKMAACVVQLIQAEMGSTLGGVDRVVVPHQSSVLLGSAVAERLQLPLLVLRKEPTVFANVYWEGKVSRGDKCLMVHDVTVEARQLKDGVEKLQEVATVEGIFCLVSREEFAEERNATIDALGIPFAALCSYSDSDIRGRER